MASHLREEEVADQELVVDSEAVGPEEELLGSSSSEKSDGPLVAESDGDAASADYGDDVHAAAPDSVAQQNDTVDEDRTTTSANDTQMLMGDTNSMRVGSYDRHVATAARVHELERKLEEQDRAWKLKYDKARQELEEAESTLADLQHNSARKTGPQNDSLDIDQGLDKTASYQRNSAQVELQQENLRLKKELDDSRSLQEQWLSQSQAATDAAEQQLQAAKDELATLKNHNAHLEAELQLAQDTVEEQRSLEMTLRSNLQELETKQAALLEEMEHLTRRPADGSGAIGLTLDDLPSVSKEDESKEEEEEEPKSKQEEPHEEESTEESKDEEMAGDKAGAARSKAALEMQNTNPVNVEGRVRNLAAEGLSSQIDIAGYAKSKVLDARVTALDILPGKGLENLVSLVGTKDDNLFKVGDREVHLHVHTHHHVHNHAHSHQHDHKHYYGVTAPATVITSSSQVSTEKASELASKNVESVSSAPKRVVKATDEPVRAVKSTAEKVLPPPATSVSVALTKRMTPKKLPSSREPNSQPQPQIVKSTTAVTSVRVDNRED